MFVSVASIVEGKPKLGNYMFDICEIAKMCK